jgi:ribosomal protein L11 methyltransferase
MTKNARRWLELRVRCPVAGDEREVLLADGLIHLGACGVEEQGGWYISYFDEPDDPSGFVSTSLSALSNSTGLSSIEVEHRWQLHEDWEENWKRGLGPRRVTDRIVVFPSWAHPENLNPEDIGIRLDPGMAFGTAEHGTTRGCLRLLDNVVSEGDRVIDVGSGSGILSIAAARLGAVSVQAIEGDRYACEAARDNVIANEVGTQVTVTELWATSESLIELGPVAGIVANIEAGILEPLHKGFRGALISGGWLILSGILDHEWMRSRERAVSNGFALIALDQDGEWRSGLFRRMT